jgi:hypothetical protein
VAIHNRPSRSTKAKSDPIQGGFAPEHSMRGSRKDPGVGQSGSNFSRLVPPGFVLTDGKPAHVVAENLFTFNSSFSASLNSARVAVE